MLVFLARSHHHHHHHRGELPDRRLHRLGVDRSALFALVVLFMPDATPEHRRRIKSLGSSGAGAALFFAVWALESQIADVAVGTGARPAGDLAERHNWLSSFPLASTYYLAADALALARIRWSRWSASARRWRPGATSATSSCSPSPC